MTAESTEARPRLNKSENVRVSGSPNPHLDKVRAMAKARKRLCKEEKFKSWLCGSANLSPRVTRDILSRCRRVQIALGIRLEVSVRNQQEFKKLTDQINEYAITQPLSAVARRNLANVLRYAVRKYAAFSVGLRALRYPNRFQSRENWQQLED